MNRMAIIGGIAIVLITGAVYASGVFNNEFVEWDDGLLMTNNPMIQGLNWDNLKEAFTSYDPELYIPLTFLSYQIDYAIWGLNPVGFHLTNLLLHIGNALLVMRLIWFLLCHGERSRTIPFLCALLFAIHPLHTEAVMWASARKDVLMGFFFLLSLNLYIAERKWWSLFIFVLACMAKVTAVMLPFILLLIDWHQFSLPHGGRVRERGSIWNFILNKIPYFAISAMFIVVALFGKAGSHGLWWEKVLIGAKATMFYLQKLFWPTGLSVLYPYTENISIANPDLWVPLVLVVVITTLTLTLSLKRERGYQDIAFGWFFFLFLLLPSFTNFAKGQDLLKDVYFASDRYAYLASIGIIYLVVLFLSRISCPAKLFERSGVGLLGIVGLLGFFSYHQSFAWQTTESLFTNVVQNYPNSHVAQNNLGSLYYRRGEIDRAIEKYKESLAVRPNATAFFNLGVIYMDNGYPAIAREAFHQALKLNPGDTEARAKLNSLP